MQFNSMEFLIFYIVVLCIYWVLPYRLRYLWLLASSCYFYMQWNAKYVALLLFDAIVVYIGAHVLDKAQAARVRKLALFLCLLLCLGVLAIFKYADFAVNLCNRLLSVMNLSFSAPLPGLVLPVGISFYTIQAIGYLIDVYRREVYAEKNFLRFFLFLSFFPQLVAGPIERSKNLLKQLGTRRYFSFLNLRKGFLLILWGLFVKMVIADRAAIFVDNVYGDYNAHGGLYIIIATMLFAIQIYCDFYGYSTIARGCAFTFGYTLVDNFNAPYFSGSVKEFWRRWHISLSTWFRDYLYIPLGGNRKGKLRKNCNLMIVFGISGLWHGAALSYPVWGCLNGLYQVVSDLTYPIRKRIAQRVSWVTTYPEKIGRVILNFLLICLTWLFFRAGFCFKALKMLYSALTIHNWNILIDDSLYNLGISRKYFGVLLFAIGILGVVDYLKYKGGNVAERFLRQHFWFRLLSILVLLFMILLFGCYGDLYDAASFIYFQF